jgi:hypothetical protein
VRPSFTAIIVFTPFKLPTLIPSLPTPQSLLVQSTGTRHYLINLAHRPPPPHSLYRLYTNQRRLHSFSSLYQKNLSHRPGVQPGVLQTAFLNRYVLHSPRLFSTFLCNIVLTYKPDLTPVNNMIFRELESNNMGRGAYDTTGTPKPPPPPPK